MNNRFSGPIPAPRGESDTRERLAYARLPVRVLSSDALFQGEQEIGIAHEGSLYRLKITRQGKLILNK